MTDRLPYRGLFAAMAVVAIGAVLFGTVGLYTVLTGGTDVSDDESLLGAYDCDSFDGDPEMPHESEIGDPYRAAGDSQLESFTVTGEDDRRIEMKTIGPLINASASQPDGTVVPVERFPDENRLVITPPDRTPVRVFIDSLDNDGTAFRTELDICPPGTGST